MRPHFMRFSAVGAALALLMSTGYTAQAAPSSTTQPQPVIEMGEQQTADPVVGTSSDPGPAPMIFGWVHLAPGVAVVDAQVTLRTIEGRIVAPSVRTGVAGEFAVDTRELQRPRFMVLEARGGTVAGKPWNGVLRAVVTRNQHRHMAHVNAATTMAAIWQLRKKSRTYPASMNRARDVLRVSRVDSIEAGYRLALLPVSSQRMLTAIERRGWRAWLRSQVRNMENRRPGPAMGVRAGDSPTMITPAGAGSTAAGLLWNAVLSAAESCDPSSSSIPGVGYLASALADTGFVSQDPTCGELKEILNDLEAIQQGINEIEAALQATSNQLMNVGSEIKLDALSNQQSQLQIGVLSPIKVGQAAYTFLTNNAQTTVTRLGMSLGDILTSTDDTITKDPDVTQLRTYAQNVLIPSGALGTGFAVAVTSLTANGIITDSLGGSDKGILHLAWEAVRTLSVFIDANQLSLYNQAVAYLRQFNSHAAALSIDAARAAGETSEQISQSLIGTWELPDSYFAGVSTELLPCPSVDDTLRGWCEPLTITDGVGAVQNGWDHTSVVVDPDSGLMWSSVCAAEGMSVAECEATGIMSFTRGNGSITPYWFNTPVSMTWGSGTSAGGAFARPTSTQINTLAEQARKAAQQSSSIPGWVASQSPVFATVSLHPIASTSIAFDCGWAAPTDPFTGKPMKDGEAYFICPATQICKDGFKNPFQPDIGPGSCFGLQGAGYTVAEDLLGGSHRIGWALPSATTTTNLPLASQPAAPTNILESQVILWQWDELTGCGYDEDKSPPTSGNCYPYTMGTYTAPLVVRSVDISPYTVSAWVNQ